MSSVDQTKILGIIVGSAVGSILIGSAINHIWSGYSEEKDNGGNVLPAYDEKDNGGNVLPAYDEKDNGGNVLPAYDNIFMQKIISTKIGSRCIICHNDHFFDPSSDPNGNICWCDHGKVSHILYNNNEYSQKPSDNHGNHSIATASAGTRRLRKNNNKTKRGLSKKSKKHKRRTRRRHKKN